ncbi:MAG: anti-anti-sigma factor [Myxococcota bacterium]|jgi:anti-anti-sigma factor
MAITSEISAEQESLAIKVSGRFDFSLHEEFRASYSEVEAKGLKVVVDLAEVEYMDSSALGMLLLLREYVGEDQAKVRLINGAPEIMNILHVSNFDQLFKVE